MVKVTKPHGNKFSGGHDRGKSRTVSKHNLSKKDSSKIKGKKRSEKEVKTEKKIEMVKRQRRIDQKARHQRFMPGVYNDAEKQKDALHSEGMYTTFSTYSHIFTLQMS
jgi:hypothetical protein